HMSHGFCSRKTWNIRDCCVRSQVEKDAITGQRPPASIVQMRLNGPGSYKPRFTSNQICSRGPETIEVKLNLTLDHLSLAPQEAFHIRRHRPCLDAVFRAVTSEPGSFRAANHILAGEAGNVRTRSANVLPLHHCGAPAFLSHGPRQVLSGLPTSNDQDFVAFCFSHRPPPWIRVPANPACCDRCFAKAV